MHQSRVRLERQTVRSKKAVRKRAIALLASVILGAMVAANASSPIPFGRVSVSTANAQADKGGSFLPDQSPKHSVSYDGQQVVFDSDATQLVTGDTNAAFDVFVKNYKTSAINGSGATTRVSVADNEAQGDAASANGAISASYDGTDGRYVVFASSATNLTDDNGDTFFTDDTNGFADIFIRDRDADNDGILDEAGAASTTRRVNISTTAGLANGNSGHPVVSADGRWVAFESDATNLVAGDANIAKDIFVRDMTSNTVVRVNRATAGAEARGASNATGFNSYNPSISGDGRHVVFESDAVNLVASDTNAARDIFIRDRDADLDDIYDEAGATDNATKRLNVSTAGAQSTTGALNTHAFMGADTDSGRYVTFYSNATNLVAGDTNATGDIFLRDRDTDNDGVYDEAGAVSTELVSLGDGGVLGNGAAAHASVSADGRFVAFDSLATNLVAGDLNVKADTFVRDRAALRTYRVSATKTYTEANDESAYPMLSADSRVVAFDSAATNLATGLATGDTNASIDVFLRDMDAGMVPSEPTGLTVTRNAASDPQHKLTLVWTDNAVNETGYEVWRYDYDEAGYQLLPSSTGGYPTVGPSIKTFINTGLTEDHAYKYLVRAVNGVGASDVSNEAVEYTWPSLPAAPTGAAVSVLSSSQLTVSWDDNATNESGFEVFRKLRSQTTWPTAAHAVLPPDGEVFNDDELSQATLYDYKVRAYNAAGASAFTAVVSGTTTLPAPTNLKAAAETSSTAKLVWTDNSGVETGFKIEKSTGGAFSEIGSVAANVTTYTATGLSSEATTQFRVRAFTGTIATPTALSAFSNTVSLYVLAAPSSLTATAISKTQINLAWTNNTSTAQSLKLERKIGAGGVWGVIATLAPTVTSFSNTGLSPESTAFYRLRAYSSGSGYSSYSNEASATTFRNVPTAPTGFKVKGTSSTTVLVEWTDNTNENGYKLERILNGGTWATIATLGANTVSFVDTGRTPDRTYSYRLRAFNESGSSGNTAAQVVDMLKKPTNLVVITNTAASVKIGWTNNSALETGYEIWRKTGVGAYVKIGTVASATATSYTDGTVATGTTYTYKVLAYDPNSSSDFSNELTVITP